ncbi:unnamed protein product [Sphagnum balticum]
MSSRRWIAGESIASPADRISLIPRETTPPPPPASHVGFRLILMLAVTVVVQLDVSHRFRVFAVAMFVLFRRRAVRAFAMVLLSVFLVRLAVLLARLQCLF